MSLLVERFGDYSFVQALGASFKEVQKSPKAISGTLKGIIGIINTIGLVIVLGAPVYALAQALKITDKIIKIYTATAEIDLWVNYKFEGWLVLSVNIASTFNKAIALPQLLCDLKVIPFQFPKFIGFGTDALNLLTTFYDLSKLIPKAFEYRTDRPLKRTERKLEIWTDILNKLKVKDKNSAASLINTKKLKVEKIDQDILEAALITYAHDKKVKWENKKDTLFIRQKSNMYSIAFNVSRAALSTFLIAGAITSLVPFLACATISGLFVSYFGLYSFLYDTFNPEMERVKFNHTPIKG